MESRRISLILFVAIFNSVSYARGQVVDGYAITRVGTLPSPSNSGSTPDAINNNGQVLIDSGGNPNTRAAIYTNGSLQNLGTLSAPYNYMSYGSGLNDSGQACGASWLTSSDTLGYHAFLYSGGQMKDLGTLPGYTLNSQATAINNNGQVVGDSETSTTSHAFTYSNGIMHDLGSLPGYATSTATGVNNAGQIVGYCYQQFGPIQPGAAFISGPSGLSDLGSLPAPYNYSTEAYAINNNGQVIGAGFNSAGDSHAFLWTGGVMTDLGTLPGLTLNVSAQSINDEGEIIGYSQGNSGSGSFLYSDGVMTNLNTEFYTAFNGWQLGTFGPINDAGQIAVAGYYNNVYQTAILTPVPEPACFGVVIICVAIRGLRRNRHGIHLISR